MSEFLIYPNVGPEFIERIIVPIVAIEHEINNLIHQFGLNIKVIVDPNCFN